MLNTEQRLVHRDRPGNLTCHSLRQRADAVGDSVRADHILGTCRGTDGAAGRRTQRDRLGLFGELPWLSRRWNSRARSPSPARSATAARRSHRVRPLPAPLRVGRIVDCVRGVVTIASNASSWRYTSGPRSAGLCSRPSRCSHRRIVVHCCPSPCNSMPCFSTGRACGDDGYRSTPPLSTYCPSANGVRTVRARPPMREPLRSTRRRARHREVLAAVRPAKPAPTTTIFKTRVSRRRVSTRSATRSHRIVAAPSTRRRAPSR